MVVEVVRGHIIGTSRFNFKRKEKHNAKDKRSKELMLSGASLKKVARVQKVCKMHSLFVMVLVWIHSKTEHCDQSVSIARY